METFIKMIINISLLLGSSYCGKEFLSNVEKTAIKRIKKRFLSSERLTRKIHWYKTAFLII